VLKLPYLVYTKFIYKANKGKLDAINALQAYIYNLLFVKALIVMEKIQYYQRGCFNHKINVLWQLIYPIYK
jgi:hypothetical protein